MPRHSDRHSDRHRASPSGTQEYAWGTEALGGPGAVEALGRRGGTLGTAREVGSPAHVQAMIQARPTVSSAPVQTVLVRTGQRESAPARSFRLVVLGVVFVVVAPSTGDDGSCEVTFRDQAGRVHVSVPDGPSSSAGGLCRLMDVDSGRVARHWLTGEPLKVVVHGDVVEAAPLR